mmetsp:Transcript_38613/g.111406  ORF Transcript_38613/g.111406 Transcript_38613/m.111406 type:complete len:210 (-) Transcript_38613:137-766(-)
MKAPVLSSCSEARFQATTSRDSTAAERLFSASKASGRFGALSSWLFCAKTWFTIRLATVSPSLSPNSSYNFKESCAGASASFFFPAASFAQAKARKVLASPALSASSRRKRSAAWRSSAAPMASPRAMRTSDKSCRAVASEALSPVLRIIASSSVALRFAAILSPRSIFALTTTSNASIFEDTSLARRAVASASPAALMVSSAASRDSQ